MNSLTLARYEFKYAIRPDLMDGIREFIRPYCKADEHGEAGRGGFYTINTLYFDDDRYSFYWDAADNVPVRAKLRVRGYGDLDSGVAKLEVKRRIYDQVVKSSFCVKREDWTRWLVPPHATHRAGLSAAEREALDSFLILERTRCARPKMLVRYERQAFRSVIDNYVRVTFDRNMVHQPMNSCSLRGWPNRWKAMDDQESMGGRTSDVVMELKFIRAAPPWLVDMVRHFGLVRRGYSKYCCAVRRSALERDTCRDLIPAIGAGWLGWRAGWAS